MIEYILVSWNRGKERCVSDIACVASLNVVLADVRRGYLEGREWQN